MTKDEIYEKLAEAYVQNIKRDKYLYNTLKKVDIYIEEERNPYTTTIENILSDEFYGDFLSSLFDLAWDGYTIVLSKENEAITVSTIQDVIKYYKE